ncbi:MAG: hypothetical protein QF466_04125 [Desulfobacterales bacterium]|nr:hypothetical protein [Desulfobacterales bacterium]MDP6681872.1 hypothetical protein [Desulfobacterales bacterium]MDP6808821.1 hypothetical protein [Desulfobacterales bacterium]
MEELLINGFSDCTAGSSAKICRLIGMTGILTPAVSAICAAHVKSLQDLHGIL